MELKQSLASRREDVACLDLEEAPKRRFSKEFKELAVRRMRSGQPAAAIAAELGVSAQSLYRWSKAAEQSAAAASSMAVELERLRREVQILQIRLHGCPRPI